MIKKYFTEEEKRNVRKLEAKKYYDKKRKQPLSEEQKEKIRLEKIEKRKEYEREYYKQNKEKILKQSKEYFKNNQEEKQNKNNERYKLRRKIDPVFKLKGNIRRGILGILKRKGFTKKSKTQDILGCSFNELKQHLESKFESWMTWENHGLYNGTEGYGWDVDHIIPSSTGKTEEEINKLNNFTNLQPLCSKINRDIKRDNIVTVSKINNISKITIK